MELKQIYKEIEKIIKKATTEGLTKEDYHFIIRLRDSLCYHEYFLNEVEHQKYCLFFDKLQNIIRNLESSNLIHKYSIKTITDISQKAFILPLVLADRTSDKMRMQGPNGYMFVCPIHNEKTPSFRVKDYINGFYCFGCGVSGNVFRYVQSANDMKFIDSVDLLLKIYMYQDTKKDDKYYELISKYQQSIISPEYKEFLLMGEERLKKYNMDFMPNSSIPVSDYYADKLKMIERIENRCLDTSLKIERPTERIMLLTDDDINEKPLQKQLVLKPDNLYMNKECPKVDEEDYDDDDELPF